MSSRLPQSRPSRRVRNIIGIGIPGARTGQLAHLDAVSRLRREALVHRLDREGARLDTDPNGYTICRSGRIVARCPNLDAVETWLREEWKSNVRAAVQHEGDGP